MPFQQAPKLWLYSHNFTHTGAPLVLGAIARELAEQGWRRRLRLVSWGGHHDRVHTKLRRELEAEGFNCRVLNPEQAAPKPKPNDRILLNSLALPPAVIKTAIACLEHGAIKRLDWYGHEGNPSQLLGDKQWPQRLLPLLSTGKLQMRVPSIHTLGTYQNWLEYSGSNLAVQNPKLNITSIIETKEPDFNELKFHLTGMAGDGNKGHIWLLRLMQELLNRENQANKEKTSNLRKVKLHFIGLEIDKSASLARELRYWGRAIMGENFIWTGHGNHQDTIRSMAKANIAVSCSKAETFSMASLEAMHLGNPLLRNRTGGWEEQLMDGINGFDLGETEQKPGKKQIELVHRLRNTLITPSNKLTAMSIAASKHSQIFQNIKYANWLLN